MYKNKPYGLYRFGYVEDLEKIDEKNLYQYYQELINQCKIDIFVSGLVDEGIQNIIKENEKIKKLKERESQNILPELEINEQKEENIIQESMDIAQGKLVIGLDIEAKDYNSKFPVSIYNVILRRKCNI